MTNILIFAGFFSVVFGLDRICRKLDKIYKCVEPQDKENITPETEAYL